MNFIYFINGYMYATDGLILISISLQEINADPYLIKFLDGNKIFASDMSLINQFKFLHLDENGVIYLNSRKSIKVQLYSLEQEDTDLTYCKMIDMMDKVVLDKGIHQSVTPAYKISTDVLNKLNVLSSKFNVMKLIPTNQDFTLLVEFGNKKSSYAIIMTMFF